MPSTASPSTSQSHRVLFVCLGNICRSPLAEAVFRHRISTSTSAHTFPSIDSAGTGAYHAQSPPDPRSLATLGTHGITSYTHAARKVRLQDFEDFDWVFAMDAENFEDLVELKEKVARRRRKGIDGAEEGLAKVALFGAFAGGKGEGLCQGWEAGEGEEVVDPYYGGGEGFEIAWEQAVRFTEGFLSHLDGGGDKI